MKIFSATCRKEWMKSSVTTKYAARKSCKAMNQQEMTAYQIAELVTWMPEQGGVNYADLKPVAQLSAVSETLAHLKAMSVDEQSNL